MKRSFLLLPAATLCGLSGCRQQPAASVAPPPSPGAPIRLVDRLRGSGIDFRLGHGGRSPLNILDTIGHGAALVDVDGDGRLDVLLTGPDQVRLYRNLGGWRFQDVTAASGLRQKGYWQGCAVGDVDNDGKPDLYLAAKGGAALYRNLGGGKFQEMTEVSGLAVHDANRWNSAAEWLDYDGDGQLDLYVGAYVDLGDHSGLCLTQGIMTGCGPLHYRPQKGVLYHNGGNWRFRATAAGLGHGKTLGAIACAFDGGKRPWLYVANDQMEGDMLRQSPAGSWGEDGLITGTSTGPDGSVQGGMGVTVADYDGDGRLDLFVTTFHQEPDSLYHNEGGGTFRNMAFPSGIGAATTRRVGFGTRFADLDNDAWPDLAIANGHPQELIHRVDTTADYAQPSQILRNLGDGRFSDVTQSSGTDLVRPIVGRALCTGDLDNDGKVDLLISDLEGAPLLLQNVSPARNAWVRLRLEGRTANRSGQGAIVTCTARGPKQTALATTGGSYYSASDPRVHFGLGPASGVVTIRVNWPGGATQIVTDVPFNRESTIKQPHVEK